MFYVAYILHQTRINMFSFLFLFFSYSYFAFFSIIDFILFSSLFWVNVAVPDALILSMKIKLNSDTRLASLSLARRLC